MTVFNSVFWTLCIIFNQKYVPNQLKINRFILGFK